MFNAYISLGEPTRKHGAVLKFLGFEPKVLKSRISFRVEGFVDKFDLGRNLDEALQSLASIAKQRWILTYKGSYLLGGAVITGMDLVRMITKSASHKDAWTAMIAHPGKLVR